MKKQKGFSLIELLIVVAIILIIAAIAIPNLLRSKMAANEASAVGSIRTINTAQVTYSASWGVGYATNLARLGDGGVSPCAAASTTACLSDGVLAAGVKRGYNFSSAGTLAGAGVNNGFEANAWPVALGTTGQRAFCSDQTGVLRFNVAGLAIGLGAGACAGVATTAGTSGPLGN